jgi:hypothetical protein
MCTLWGSIKRVLDNSMLKAGFGASAAVDALKRVIFYLVFFRINSDGTGRANSGTITAHITAFSIPNNTSA